MSRRPLTNEEGEVRELTAEDFQRMRSVAEASCICPKNGRATCRSSLRLWQNGAVRCAYCALHANPIRMHSGRRSSDHAYVSPGPERDAISFRLSQIFKKRLRGLETGASKPKPTSATRR